MAGTLRAHLTACVRRLVLCFAAVRSYRVGLSMQSLAVFVCVLLKSWSRTDLFSTSEIIVVCFVFAPFLFPGCIYRVGGGVKCLLWQRQGKECLSQSSSWVTQSCS